MENVSAKHRVIVCTTCAAPGEEPAGEALVAALAARLGDGFAVEAQECLSICAEPQAVAFRAPGKAAYLFAGLRPADDADIEAFARLWADTPDGWIEDARPAGRLRFCLKGRIPG